MKIVLTGATGFVGGGLVKHISSLEDINLTALVRQDVEFGSNVRVVKTSSLELVEDLVSYLKGHDAIIHAAARAHIMRKGSSDNLSEYQRVNVAGTLNIASQAAKAGIKRFIYISSVKVNGEYTKLGRPFTEFDTPSPQDAYGWSKWEAEQGLWQIQRETGIEIVIIRPPLIYGPGVKGNFANMLRLVKSGIPLPLGAIHNMRSLVALDNLVDLIITCMEHPKAANQVFLAGDGQDVSTTELLRKIGDAMGKPARLIPVPESMLRMGARLLGREDLAQRLLGSLQVDISKSRELLGWNPPITLDEGLRRCVSKN